jgi:hypothetical protein
MIWLASLMLVCAADELLAGREHVMKLYPGKFNLLFERSDEWIEVRKGIRGSDIATIIMIYASSGTKACI